jgi:hypothetical protein
MLHVAGRPVGLWVLTIVVAVDGASFLLASYELAIQNEWPAALVAAIVGAVLLFKVNSILAWHRMGWYALFAFAVIGAVVNGSALARGHGSYGTWFSAIVAAAIALYLWLPAVRGPFFRQHGGPPAASGSAPVRG